MERLTRLLGTEHSLDEINLALRYHVEELRPSAVGAMLVTCADESERECAEAFQKSFVAPLLPEIKFWQRAPFRIANLGGRYEWGALPLAEQHFAVPASRDAYKILLVKINSHVAVGPNGRRSRFGTMNRYDTASTACGALHALLDGSPAPFIHELQEAFGSEGKDRLAMLRDADQVEPGHRTLFAAIVSARLQARHAILDIQDYQPTTPTVYLVVACVTLNRPDADTELFCGYYMADCRADEESFAYHGLGDDPSRYRLRAGVSRLQIEDDQIHGRRPARNHRRLVAEEWRRRTEQSAEPARPHAAQRVPAGPGQSARHDVRIAKIIEDARSGMHHHHNHARPMLRMLLGVLMELSPIPAAIMLFAEGLGSIHHAHRLHRAARELDRHEDARLVLSEVCDKIDDLPPERAKEVIDVLLGHYDA